MTVKTIEYPSAPRTDTARSHSRTIWKDCPWDQIISGEKDGVAFFDDFNALPLTPTLTTQIAYGQYKAYAVSTNTIIAADTVNAVYVPGGILQLLNVAAGTAANISIATAYPAFSLSGSTGTDNKLWFEARVAVQQLVATSGCFFVGLAETSLLTLATNLPFTSGTGLAWTTAGGAVGWKSQTAQTISGQLNAVYTDRATTFTFPGASTAADALLGATFTFIKLGMIYDPSDKEGKQIRFFANGVPIAAAITAANITATTSLKAKGFGLLLTYNGGAGAAATDAVYMDWWRCAQLYTNP